MKRPPRIWIDADNPPQAQYLAPMAEVFRKRGCDVLMTARDHPATLAILEERGERPIVLGRMFGPSRLGKIIGNLGRITYLSRATLRHFGGRPDALVVGQARGAILTAGVMRVPTFVILDYEGVEIASMKWTGAFILHPQIVSPLRFEARGFPGRRLIAVPGLKEDLTFHGIDTGSQEPARFPRPRDERLPAVLVRPPSQTSHYASEKSVQMLCAVLDSLARRDDVQVVLSPREAAQEKLLAGREWAVEPVILEETMPLVPLLRSVGWVVTGGGTMVREAAWLGVPAVSVFTGDPPAVDEWLAAKGAIFRVLDPAGVESIDWSDQASMEMIEHHPEAVDAICEIVLARARTSRG